VDFYASAAKLVVEVDGAWHGERTAADRRRDRVLGAFGYRVER
jgi:very-short-patch-repair endonuclease